ncbi:MAG: radical SAM protein [Candidatus Omnitrophota bacterium]
MKTEKKHPLKVFIHIKENTCIFTDLFAAQLVGYFKRNQVKMTPLPEADIIIVVVCSNFERKIVLALEVIKSYEKQYPDKKIIITGCFLEKNLSVLSKTTSYYSPLNAGLFDDLFKPKVPLEQISANVFGPGSEKGTNKEKIYNILVSLGCNNKCSYCIKNKIFPAVKSRDFSIVKKEFRNGIKKGFRNFSILGTDVSLYGKDIGMSVVDLFAALFKEKKEFTLSVFGFEPGNFLKYFDELRKYFKTKKIIYLFLAIQSGSNKVLKDMNRKYTVEDIKKMVKELRRLSPGILIETDIIYCFPTETADDFQKTISILHYFDKFTINIFNRHKGTKAYGMKDVFDAKEKARRTEQIKAITSGHKS